MRETSIVICEICGGATPSASADFLVFHCLSFCSPDCLDDYRAADQDRRAKKDTGLAQKPGAGRSPAA
jgi:hypothetical protein